MNAYNIYATLLGTGKRTEQNRKGLALMELTF